MTTRKDYEKAAKICQEMIDIRQSHESIDRMEAAMDAFVEFSATITLGSMSSDSAWHAARV